MTKNRIINYLLDEIEKQKQELEDLKRHNVELMEINKTLSMQHGMMVERVRKLQGKEVEETVDNRERDLQ